MSTPQRGAEAPVTLFGPDFPFAFDDWIAHPQGLGELPAERLGQEVAIIGAGMSGMLAAYELMKLGLKPVIYEAGRIGGRLRSQSFEGAEGIIAELGRHALSRVSEHRLLPLCRTCSASRSKPFPNPLVEASALAP
jgi:hypothetical protein